ncbi:uncharacterized protein LOC129171247 isoform X2 [Dunckerocampus dactyliophorus]|uniref:uncharacterized protein LOC129171247 isoform X2 n=1 Tax=Dunckerocampus dactyliophorus TaxID=161453 RepID=UPI00240770BB|nr:uncharacterized protein LOC129171247 isoform X2 [Dunckerocampus dactyliophorus]
MMPPLAPDPSCGKISVGRKLSLLFERQQQDMQHVRGLQASILQLQRDCEDLQKAVGRLHDDNKHKHLHILQLLRSQDQLQDTKADKHSLHAKVCQLDKLIQDQWNDIQERMSLPEHSQHRHAAAVRKQLLCLSCDPPIITHLQAPTSVGVSPSRTLTDVADFRYPKVSRSCGGGHTVTSGSQRRFSVWRHHSHAAGGATVQSEATKTMAAHEVLSKASRPASARTLTPQNSPGRTFGAKVNVAPPPSGCSSTS